MPTPEIRSRGRPWAVVGRVAAWLTGPIDRFLRIEAASGLLLLACTGVATCWANSPWAASYFRLWMTPLGAGFDFQGHREPLRFWINDGLMTLFFLVVGLEIRQELRHGSLAGPRRAALPVLAAAGGMAVPAILYAVLNGDPATQRGWGIPTATDIAFSVGALSLLGRRVPQALRVLLLAIATADDIGSVLVVTVFYPSTLAWQGLAIAAGATAGLVLLRLIGIPWRAAHLLGGVVVWYGLLRAGLQPAMSGVLVALLLPVTERDPALQSTQVRMANWLHAVVAFGVVPLFALANAGVDVQSVALDRRPVMSVAAGVFLARVLGKPIGIGATIAAAAALRLGELSNEINWQGVLLIGCLGGIGFTVPIFIAGEAFSASALVDAAKLSLLVASAVSAIIGLVLGRVLLAEPASPDDQTPLRSA